MKITCSTKMLLAALSSQKSIIKPSRPHPILGNVCFIADGKTLTIEGMDLEKKKSLAIPCRVIKPGSVCINYAPLFAYLSTRSEPDCEISVDDKNVSTIKLGRSVNKMPGLPIGDRPPWVEPVNPKSLTIPAALFNECLTKSLVQAATEDTRGYLVSVMFVSRNGMLNIQATNGQRMIIHYTDIPYAKNEQCIIPSDSISSLSTLATMGDVELKIGDNILTASVENCQYSTKLIEANVQDFEKTFPPQDKLGIKIIVEREKLLAEIVNAETQVSEERRSIAIVCDGSEITIQAQGQDIGNVTNPCDVKPRSHAISFAVNPQFMRDALNAFDEDEVTIHFLDEITPFLIRNESKVSVVYPQRLG